MANADKDSWFTFDKKPTDDVSVDDGMTPQTSSSATTTPSVSSSIAKSSNTEFNTNNRIHEEVYKTSANEKTKKSSPS